MAERILVTLTVDQDGIHRLSACLDGLPEVLVITNAVDADALRLGTDVLTHLVFEADPTSQDTAADLARAISDLTAQIEAFGETVTILVDGKPFDAAAAEAAARALAHDDNLIF